ncbi:MAG: protein translocase subunit SecD [Lentisphaeria bacterium]|nr:protein translocase subunit SecD [Lentisphaeria bacterium]
MNKKPVLLRSLFALLVLGVFIFSMFPLGQKDFIQTLSGMMVDPANAEYQEIVALAREKLKKEPAMFASTAIEEAAAEIEKKNAAASGKREEIGKSLLRFVNPVIVKSQKFTGNKDVIAHARRLSSSSIRLGIDLHGGVEFMLKLEPQAADGLRAQDIEDNFDRYRDIAIENLRERIEGLNIYESEITPAGGDMISLRIPTVSKEEKVKLQKLIEMSARLSFNLVHPQNSTLVAQYLENPKTFQVPSGYKLMESVEADGPRGSQIYFVKRDQEMDGKNITNAFVNMTQFGQREIILNFNSDGAVQFANVTKNNVGRQLAIILDGKLYSAPTINQAITGGNAQITGNFSREDAENIANALVSGSVPFKMKIQAQYDIDPTIGAETVRDGMWSGIAGTILVMIFMLLYYRKSGIVANISLLFNAAMMVGAIAAFNITLTLPGIAGIILTIGMAVDANVLFYERIREEMSKGKNVISAIEIGFSKAFVAVFDSNITTLFVAAILLWLGTGAIKGFAMTLAVGIFTTLFTAVFLTHLLFDLMARINPNMKLSMFSFVKKQLNLDFLSPRKIAFSLSGILIIAILVTCGIRGKDILGIDFTGGTQIELGYSKAIPAEDIAKILTASGYDVKVLYKSSGSVSESARKLEVLCRPTEKTETIAAEQQMSTIVGILNGAYPDAKFVGEKQSTLGALIGWTFAKSAMLSLGLAVLGMIFYLTLRFQFSYSIAANVAVIHDVIIGVGLYVMCGGQITMNVVAAGLTLIGYSVNDTIVNFDRIRENLRIEKGMNYSQIINLSLNQTFARTMLTTLTTLLVVLMQLFFGGASIRDFVCVMLIGMVSGVYSTLYIATPIIDTWHKKDKNIHDAEIEPKAVVTGEGV